MISIKLSIEGTIPRGPIRQLHEESTSEALDTTFLWKSLESVNYFRHLDVTSHVRHECIQGCLEFVRCHTPPLLPTAERKHEEDHTREGARENDDHRRVRCVFTVF
jgi:hypothetical protein